MIKHIIKNNNNLNNTPMAYIELEPKSSHTFKYSQPLELVLFHVIAIRIKCLKGSYYPHLLNNYLINYLNFSGLTFPQLPLFDPHVPERRPPLTQV